MSKIVESVVNFGKSAQCNEFVRKCDAKWLYENIAEYPVRESDDVNYNPQKIVVDYLKEILKSKNGIIKRTYYNNDGYGRMYLKGGQNGFQNIMREYRAFLCYRNYYDLDLVNAQPSILLSVCENLKIDCYYLNKYVCFRKDLFDEIMADNKKLTKDQLKVIFISIMNGAKTGGVDKLNLSEKTTKFVKKFSKEMEDIRNVLLSREENKIFVAQAEIKKNTNIDGTAMAYYLQNQENIIIQYAKKYLTKKGYDIGALIFDGLMVRNNVPLSSSVINDLNKYILKSTNIKIEFIIKPFEVPHMPNEAELTYKDEIIVDNDEEASKIILNDMNNEIVKSENNYFYRKFPNTNIYEEDKSQGNRCTKDKLFSIISKYDIKISTANGIKDYSKNTMGCKKIVDMTFTNLPNDTDFTKKLFDLNLNKLCFLNGYYNIIDNKFYMYDNKCYTLKYVDKNYIENVDQQYINILNDKILIPILGDEYNSILRYFSRCIFGTMDKKWAVGLGARNTGKSQLTKLFELTFNNYVKVFNAENLMCMRVGGGDVAKKLSWLSPFQYCRLYLSNEMKTEDDNDKKLTLDCNQIKSISSGGDTKEIRQNYENERTIQLQGNMFLFMNELAKLSSKDATETLHQFNFNTIFVDEISEQQKKINEADTGFKYMLKDDKIKDLLNDLNIQNAFIKLLINNFGEHIKPTEDNNFDNNDDDENDKLENLFVFTLNKDDKLSCKDIKEVLKNNDIIVSASKLKIYLNKNGCENFKSGPVKGYKCLKVKL